jgi:hypothetical protein
VAGLVFLLISAVAALRQEDLSGRSVTADATVAEIATLARSGGGERYSAVYQFKDSEGRVWRIHSAAFSELPPFSQGQRIRVRYPSGDPGSAVVVSGSGPWGPIAIGTVTGLILTVAGLSVIRRRRRS